MCLDSHTWTHCYPNEMQHGVLMAYLVYLVHWLLGEKYKPGLRTAQPYMSSIRHLCCTKMHRKNITLNFLVFAHLANWHLNSSQWWPLKSIHWMPIDHWAAEWSRYDWPVTFSSNWITFSSQKYENKNLWSEKFKIAIEPRFKFDEYGEYEKWKGPFDH